MAEDNKGNLPPEGEKDLTPAEIESITQAEKLKGADAATVAALNSRLYARLQREKEKREKAEGDNKVLQEKLAPFERAAQAPPPPTAPVNDSLTVDTFLNFKAKGLSDVEVKAVVEKAKAMGISPAKFIESTDVFEPWIGAQRSKAKAEQNTPPASHGGPQRVGDKDLKGDALARARFAEMTSGKEREGFV